MVFGLPKSDIWLPSLYNIIRGQEGAAGGPVSLSDRQRPPPSLSLNKDDE
jgi:hypothetical protein